MKLDLPVPFERLAWFQRRLGLEAEDLRVLSTHRDQFLGKKDDFAEGLFDYFYGIPETRTILDHEERSRQLKKIWAHWYGLLFKGSVADKILTNVWRSGLRHVEINLDKRFVNLAYAFARQFVQGIIRNEIPPPHKETLYAAVDRMIDFCLLVETQAYVTATSQCDMEVVKGVSHQVRNPLTVIGGNIMRLRREVEPGNPAYRVYETILMESRRLEHLVRDVAAYSELLQKESILREVLLEEVLLNALKRLEDMPEMEAARVEMGLDPEFPHVQGDSAALETMFFHLLQNSLEAMDPKNPLIRVSSSVTVSGRTFIRVEIHNTGKWPGTEELAEAFTPFYSTKPYGTGLGLPIARIVTRKSLGDLVLEPLPGEGTRCIVTLPIAKVLPKNSRFSDDS